MIMTEKKFSGRVMLTGFLLTLALTVLARICGIVYSYFATDILYAESAFLPYLPIIKSILSCAAYGAAVGTAVALTGHSRSGAIGLYALVLVADSAAAFVFDLLSGVLRGRVLFAVLYAVLKAAMPLLCILLGLLISRRLIRDGRIPRAAVVVSLVYPVLSLVELMRAAISYLIEVDFMPYSSEIVSIVTDLAGVAASFAVSAVISYFLCRSFIRRGQNSPFESDADVQSDI